MDVAAIIGVIKRRQQLHCDYAQGVRKRPEGEELHGDKSWAIAKEYEELLWEIEVLLNVDLDSSTAARPES
ncbi:MAG TPA: hypothetical protein VFQ91_28100 [Bryobacteraceae bacterium]|nr:hypothetical protein [Bryobacteraceae bacterium]